MNRKQIKANAKTVLRKNYPASVLFFFVFHTIVGRSGSELALIFTLIMYKPSNTFTAAEKIGFGNGSFMSETAAVVSVIAIILLLTVYTVFLIGPLTIAKVNFFLKARKDGFKTKYIFEVFREDSYENFLKTMLAKNIIVFFSSLLIIPGIYFSYVYFFVPQIAADNPNMSRKEIFKLSREMTDEHKFELFILSLSFSGWYVLSCIVPVFGRYLVDPYYEASKAEAYEALKK